MDIAQCLLDVVQVGREKSLNKFLHLTMEEWFDATEFWERVRNILHCKRIAREVSNNAVVRAEFVKERLVLWSGDENSTVSKQSIL